MFKISDTSSGSNHQELPSQGDRHAVAAEDQEKIKHEGQADES